MAKLPKSDPTKDPKFQGVVDHFLKTSPQPRKAKSAKKDGATKKPGK